MVATMDTTIPPKLIMKLPRNNKAPHLDRSKYLENKANENNWVIREIKKRMGPTASNELILNTCHSTSIVNATTTLTTTTVPTIAGFAQLTPSTDEQQVDLHLSNISCSCVGFKYMTRGF
jgi:hypothetical protein